MYLIVIGTGLAGAGLEVVGVQVLSQVMQGTVYTFANTVAAYLVGTAVGAWAYQRFASRSRQRWTSVTAVLTLSLACSVVLSATAVSASAELLEMAAPHVSKADQERYVDACLSDMGLRPSKDVDLESFTRYVIKMPVCVEALRDPLDIGDALD